MVDSHNTLVAGILLAVVAVGIAGLYFTMSTPPGTVVVTQYAQSPQSALRSFDFTKPFRIIGRGQVTGLESMQFGTATINTTPTFDLRMPKNTIVCDADLLQGEDELHLYTCGDKNSTGAVLTCDQGGITNISTCSASQNDGAFLVSNNGQVGRLIATLTNVSIGGVQNQTQVLFDNIVYNCNSNNPITQNACNGTNCNNCPAPDTSGCFKALPGHPFGGSITQNVTECDRFDTSGGCICECFSIHITNATIVHDLKNIGGALEFVVKKTIAPLVSPTNATFCP